MKSKEKERKQSEKVKEKIRKKENIKRAIILIHGKDFPGIIYHMTKVLYNYSINVLDLRQTSLAGYFYMMIVIDIIKVKDMHKVKESLEVTAKKLGMNISLQLEDTYLAMHQV